MKLQKMKSYLLFGLIAVAVLVLIMMFLPSIVAEEKMGLFTDSLSGTQVAFGHSENLGFGIVAKVQPNVLALLGFLLPLVAVIALALIEKFKPELSKILLIVVVVAFVLTIVASFTVLQVTKLAMLGESAAFDEGSKLGVGAIIAAILGFLGVGAAGYKLFLEFKK